MMVFKRKQIIVLSLILMIVIAGYLQYSYKDGSILTNSRANSKLGEAVYVDNTKMDCDKDGNKVEDKKPGEKGSAKENNSSSNIKESSGRGKQVVELKQGNDYFTQAKLDREITRGKEKDALKEITQDTNSSKEVRKSAYEQMMKIISATDKEMKIETLIKEKGFNNVLALFADDGSLDIIVKSPTLTQVQVTQIADIVSRSASVDAANVCIKNMN